MLLQGANYTIHIMQYFQGVHIALSCGHNEIGHNSCAKTSLVYKIGLWDAPRLHFHLTLIAFQARNLIILDAKYLYYNLAL